MAQGVNGYVEFPTTKNWAKVRIYYNQDYDTSENESTITIESIKMFSTGYYGYNWWVDGKILVNDIEIAKFDSVEGTHIISVSKLNLWDDDDNNKLTDSSKSNVFSCSVKIPHNSDGTAAITIKFIKNDYTTFSFICTGNSAANFGINNNSAQTITLTTIPRASIISNVSDVDLGNTCSVTWTPASASFSYKLMFSMGNWSYTTDVISPSTTGEYTYDGYKLELAVADQLPNAVRGTMTVALYTYSNSACSTQIGSVSTKSFTVTVPEHVIPTIVSCAAEIVNSNPMIDEWGIAVVGYTNVKVTAVATGSYGSTISGFTISGGYNTTQLGDSLSYTGGVISSSGNKTFKVVAKDSRGRFSSTAETSEIAFYAYSKPSISSFTASRSSSDQSKVVVKGNWSFSSIDGKNSTTGTLYYKKSTATSWTTYGTISQNVSTTLTVNFDTTVSYNFKLVVMDALSNDTQDEAFISTMKVLLDFRAGGHGLGIGKICESDSMEVSLDAKFFGAVYINGVTLEEYIRSIVG